MDEMIYKIEKVVKKCGDNLLLVNLNEMKIKSKEGCGNIVTEYDIKTQKTLKEELLKILPEANFIGEEDDLHNTILENGYTFIVDPIDGTTNFARGLSSSAISVGLLKDGKPYMGVCYNPYVKEMFMAQRGKGAYLNNKPIKVSETLLKDGIVLTGNAPYYEELHQKSLDLLNSFAKNATDFRRIGSAVLELCNIACGRAEVYYELRLQPWDYAAGALIVEEAGGKVTTINGEKVDFGKPTSVIASNNKEDYLKYVNK